MQAPKLFISYCWTSADHQDWVLRLGTELRESGVDVILDKWDLKEGNDANAFMEKMVVDESIKKVILIIDEQYTKKANNRAGGVGTETQIISAEVYESVDQNKFVAVIASKDSEGKTILPVFYKSRIYIDLSDNELYGTNFEQLLRWIYDKRLNVKPELGKKPAFLNDEESVSIGTSVSFRRLIDAVKNSKPHTSGALLEYFNVFANNLDRFRLEPSEGATDFDQRVVESIEQFLPARNELIEVFSTIAQYTPSVGSAPVIHKFFESLIPYMDRPKGTNSHHDWDWDNLKFIIHESFLLCIGILLKHERFDIAEYLVKQRYYVVKDENYGLSKMSSYGIFLNHLASLKHRNTRLDLGRVSGHADLLKERCTASGLSFIYLMQADFLLYLCEAMDRPKDDHCQGWWPETLVFKSIHVGAFEIFLRAESNEYFDRVAPVLGIKSKLDFTAFIKAINERSLDVPRWNFYRIDPIKLMNYEKLCTLA